MQPSITCAGFNSNWNFLIGFSVLAVVLRPPRYTFDSCSW